MTDHDINGPTPGEVRRSVRRPISVYRLQFNSTFTLTDATELVPYLHQLGITDCYASPCFKARAGSSHGYDVSDHNALNPEIGSEKEYRNLAGQLRKYDMGQVLDIVPNHMAIFDNPKWQDVLENGPASVYARYFDIDWEPVKAELHQKVLLPILEDFYGRVLENKQLTLHFNQGAFVVNYREHRLPVGPKTSIAVLETCLAAIKETLGEKDADYLELQSILTACRNLPERRETAPERMAERHCEKEIIKRRLAELYSRNHQAKTAVDEVTASFNGVAGKSESFSKLHDLLEKQVYRLSYWRVAAEEINYRRFFDVNELVALRMEDPVVFEETHRLVFDLLAEGIVTGLRVDHVDGLFDPAGYLWWLQRARWVDLALAREKNTAELPQTDRDARRGALQEMFESQRETTPNLENFQPLYLVVEKILGEKETLHQAWPVDGTTGYEFAIALDRIFVNRRHRRALLDIYRWFTRSSDSFPEVVYQSKKLVMMTTMAAEVNVLANLLNRVSERSWQYRDFTLNSLRDAIREVIACFPVYRTYILAPPDAIDKRDEVIINAAVLEAQKRNPAVSSAIFDFVKSALLLQYPAGMDETGRAEQRLFVMHFQQFTGPVMAKGVEDTAFYIYNPLVSLNEVGGNPQKFGSSVEEFHQQNSSRRRSWPGTYITTSTHDSKRGEDVRSRINVLSEIPGEWKSALLRWRRLNRDKKQTANGEPAPDSNEEYLLYQTLLGTFPIRKMDNSEQAEYCSRIKGYMLKALREAKVHTSWISPNTLYEDCVSRFVSAILEPVPANRFITDFAEMNKLVATCGLYNSLSLTVLKLLSPGVPDIYQGNEFLAFNLTDPDNRRPVDFARRRQILDSMQGSIPADDKLPRFAASLLRKDNGAAAKLYVTWRSLNFRRDNSPLFNGSYLPLTAAGAKKAHLCAFMWRQEKQPLVVAVPRLVAGLTGNTGKAPTGNEVWGSTRLLLPHRATGSRYRNIFTGEILEVRDGDGKFLSLADVFRTFTVAVLQLMD